MTKLSHEVLLALAYVSQITDPDAVRLRFIESLNSLDTAFTFQFADHLPSKIQEERVFPITTIRSSFGYALLTENSKTGEAERAVCRSAFQFLAIILENRLQAVALESKNVSLLKEISQEKSLVRTVLDTLPVGVWIIGEKGQILTGNPAGEKIWAGVRHVGIDNYDQYKAWWPDTGKRLMPKEWSAARAIMNGEIVIDQEIDIECFDGAHKTILNSAAPLLDTEMRVVGAVCVNQDITSRNRAEKAIKLNEARLQSLLRINMYPAEDIQDLLDFTLNEAIALTGSKFGYIYFYDEAKKELILNSWSKEVMQQCTVVEAQTVYKLEKTGLWGEAVRQEKPVIINDFTTPDPLKKGVPEGHVALKKFLTIPVFNEGHIVAVVGVANKQENYNEADIRQLNLMMDAVWKIVHRKRSEKDRETLQAQFNQAQKMESVGRLAGGVAHDYNNMLSVILGYTEMCLEKVDPSNPLHDDLLQIFDAGKRSADITRQLLAFARKQTIAPKVLDLNQTVEGLLKMLRRLIGEDINLAWLPSAGLRSIKMDPSQMDQLLANLCVNARDAITGVGKITIETGMVTFDEAYCSYHLGFIPGDFVLLAVSDDGCGMNKETLSKIFEPFFTTKEEGRGTGLGLATVYGIVKQNNGFVNVYSEPGQGTTFNIYLPVYIAESGEIRSKIITESTPSGHGETIMIVEDEVAVLNLSRAMLEKFGYTVLTASAPSEAIHMAKTHGVLIDLLITDVVMPEMNGRDLSEQLHIINPKIKTLFMSGYTANVIAHRGILDEGVHFIHKPFSTNDFAVKVREVLEQQ